MRASRLIRKHQKIDRFYSGLVHEIAGPIGCGKSRLCHEEIISYLHLFPGQAIIIDTNGTFSPAIMADLIESREGDASMLDRIQITRCLNLYGVIEVLQEISSTYATQVPAQSRIGMVVIDSISNPVALMMQKGQTPGHDLMVCVTRELTLLAKLNSVCVLLVNATVKADARRVEGDKNGGTGHVGSNKDAAFSGVKIKPALGNTWPHLIDYSLLIYPVPEGTVKVSGKRGYIQEVIRSRVGGVGEWEMV